jgi:hypothetical protein
MLIQYILKIKAMHLTYLKIGILVLFKNLRGLKLAGYSTPRIKIKKFTVLKSPFVNKSARDQFKFMTYFCNVTFEFLIIYKYLQYIRILEKILIFTIISSYLSFNLFKKIKT